jgi:membrane protein DedA with SNARE-associated domain
MMSLHMTTLWFLLGKIIVSLVALATLFGALLADFLIPATAKQHIHNPHWPPHAKFHDGQTILLGVLLGAVSLGLLWSPSSTPWPQFMLAVVVASLYWIALLAAPLFPGTAWADPEFRDENPIVLGMPPQLFLALVLLLLLVIGIVLAVI